MSIEKAFGVVIRNYRRELAISQEELALEAGLDRTYISLLERGKRRPTINTLFAISKVLGINPHTIILNIETLLCSDNI
ncbi:transcriptional regulator [Priestia endophytica]|uniref:helix-turn-helix domain-containing protein n=1 Tax=Priestia endophytica TaxID=135735 RepID=UPI000DCA8278|nr:helix-turn-helix transcriptional regulator [Priestia endophytica]RAS89609.1 transcriptional regulator [Priestia endophytica]